MNVAILGRRGTGKTTWCYSMAGLDPPVYPYGTATVNFMSCCVSGINTNIWDCPPGLGRHFSNMLHTMDALVVCYNGRCIYGTVDALHAKYNLPIVVAVTREYPWSFLHLSDINTLSCRRLPVCRSASELRHAMYQIALCRPS